MNEKNDNDPNYYGCILADEMGLSKTSMYYQIRLFIEVINNFLCSTN